jgi:hypothetical protein
MPAMSPTLMPETFTAWPWPGITPCADSTSALNSNVLSPTTGTHAGGLSRWLERM